MDYLQQLQARWDDLRGRPNTKEEIEEVLKLGKLIELERAKEFGNLFLELGELGLQADSIWDLVNMKGRYPDGVVNLLLRYLPYDYHDRNKEGIVRALTVKEAKGKASEALILEYENTPVEKDDLRWVIGNAIATVMTVKDIPWVFSAVQDKNNGSSRGQLIKAVASVKSKEAENILIKLADDEIVGTAAIQALGKKSSKDKK